MNTENEYKKLRRLAGVRTQSEWAKILFVSTRTVKRWESGEAKPCKRIHSRMCDIQWLQFNGYPIELDKKTILFCERHK